MKREMALGVLVLGGAVVLACAGAEEAEPEAAPPAESQAAPAPDARTHLSLRHVTAIACIPAAVGRTIETTRCDGFGSVRGGRVVSRNPEAVV